MNDLTLSVVSHGHGPLLHRLLGDLDAQPALAGVRVVVTLNLGGEAFEPSSYPRLDILVIRNPAPRGFGANHNAAFASCTTTWFAILNPDLRLSDGEPFTRIIEKARRLTRPGALAPLIVNESGALEDAVRANLTPLSLAARRLLSRREALQPHVPARRPGLFYWLAGMCLVVSAAAFRAIGGFDERFFLYCEDYDLCARLYLADYELAVDRSASIVHEAQRDSHRSAKHLLWHVTSLLKVWTSTTFWRVTLARPQPDAAPV